jgi:hypothetical protein
MASFCVREGPFPSVPVRVLFATPARVSHYGYASAPADLEGL